MKNYYYFLLLFFSLFATAQINKTPEYIYGRLYSDSLKVDNAVVVNKTRKTETRGSQDGSFKILALPKDTLYFNHPNIVSMQYVVEDIDFKIDLKIQVYPKSTMLEEVMVYKYNLTGVLKADAKNIPTYYRDFKSEMASLVTGYDLNPESFNSRTLESSVQGVMSGNIKTSAYNPDLVKIGNYIAKALKNKDPKIPETKLHDKIYVSIGKSNIMEQLKMSDTEVDFYLEYIIKKDQLTPQKFSSYHSLDFLKYLMDQKDGYHEYLIKKAN